MATVKANLVAVVTAVVLALPAVSASTIEETTQSVLDPIFGDESCIQFDGGHHCDAPDDCSGLDGSRALSIGAADDGPTNYQGLLIPIDDPADYYEMDVPADLVRHRIRIALSFSQLDADADLSLFEPGCAALIATTGSATTSPVGKVVMPAGPYATPLSLTECKAVGADRGIFVSILAFFTGLFAKAKSACADEGSSSSSSTTTIHADVTPRECVEEKWDFRIKLFGPHGSASVPESITVEWDDGETMDVAQFRGQPVGAEHAKYRTDAKLDRAVVDAWAEVEGTFDAEFYLQQGVCFPEPEPPTSGQEAGTWFIEFTPTNVGLYVVGIELADGSGSATTTQRDGARFCHEFCLGALNDEFGYDLDLGENAE